MPKLKTEIDEAISGQIDSSLGGAFLGPIFATAIPTATRMSEVMNAVAKGAVLLGWARIEMGLGLHFLSCALRGVAIVICGQWMIFKVGET